MGSSSRSGGLASLPPVPPGRLTGVFRAGTRKDKATAGAGGPASGDSPGQHRARAGAPPGNCGSQGKPRGKPASGSPLPSRNPSRELAHTALTPRWRDWSTQFFSPLLLEIAKSRILKLSSEHVRRGKPSAAGALQGPGKSGNPSIYTHIFIRSGSILLQNMRCFKRNVVLV